MDNLSWTAAPGVPHLVDRRRATPSMPSESNGRQRTWPGFRFAWNARVRTGGEYTLASDEAARSSRRALSAGCEFAVEDRGVVAPVVLVGAQLEPALDPAHEQAEVVVSDAVDEDHACV